MERYNPSMDDRQYVGMHMDTSGQYVRYSDHEAALAEALERVKELEGRVCNLDSCTLRKRLESDNVALRKELEESREALRWLSLDTCNSHHDKDCIGKLCHECMAEYAKEALGRI